MQTLNNFQQEIMAREDRAGRKDLQVFFSLNQKNRNRLLAIRKLSGLQSLFAVDFNSQCEHDDSPRTIQDRADYLEVALEDCLYDRMIKEVETLLNALKEAR